MKITKVLNTPIRPVDAAGKASARVRSFFDPPDDAEKGISRRRLLKRGVKGLAAAGAASVAGGAVREALLYRNRPDNVVLFVADAMRADCIGKRIGGVEVTPHLNRFLSEATHFSGAYAAGYCTKPAVSSIVTGMLPPGHGVEYTFFTVPRCLDISQYYRRRGFRTASTVTNGFLNREKIIAGGSGTQEGMIVGELAPPFSFGFWRGAELFNYADVRETKAEWSRDGVINYSRFDCYIDGGEVVKSSLEEIDRLRNARLWRRSPVFAYVHLMETHRPYIKSRPLPGITGIFHFGDDGVEETYRQDAALIFELFYRGKYEDRVSRTNGASAEDVSRLRAIYYEAAHYLDQCFGAFIAGLRSMGVYDDTTIVFAGDHGEELIGQDKDVARKLLGHERPTLKTLHVPLIIKGRRFPAREVETRVSTTGILPTLMELAGDEIEYTTALSLLPAIDGFGHYPIYATSEGRDRLIMPDGTSAVVMEPGRMSYRQVSADDAESEMDGGESLREEMARHRHASRSLAGAAGIDRRFSTLDWQNPWAWRQRQLAERTCRERKIPYQKALFEVSGGLGVPEDELASVVHGDAQARIDVRSLSPAMADKLRALGYLNQ